VPECDLEASTLRRPGQTRGCHAIGGGIMFLIEFFRISHLVPKHGLEHVIAVHPPWRQNICFIDETADILMSALYHL